MIVETSSGRVRGRTDANGLCCFLGIPYAEPPVGALRFRPPVPVTPWQDIRDASAFGAASAQVFDPLEARIEDLVGEPSDIQPVCVGSEDSLTLNVWTPGTDDARRPVIIYIHGGANWLESSRVPVYHGDRFAARGDIVFASLNYRLGFFGFLDVGVLDPAYAGSHINGLHDQALALRWLKDNIAAFGGDPDNITVMGESAGSVDTSWLLASGALDGIARRAVLMSGVNTVSAVPRRHADDSRESARLAGELLGRAGIASMDQLLALSTEEVLARHADLLGSYHMLSIDSWFYPRLDAVTLTRSPYDWAASADSAAIDVMIGTTAYEMGLWLLWDDILDQRPFAETINFLGPLADDAAAALTETYRRAFPDASEGVRGMQLLSDAVFVMPSVLLAERRAMAGARTWFYQFAWEIPDSPMAAAHATDLPFAFDKMDATQSRDLFTPPCPADEEARRQKLAFAFQDAIIAFARHGDPNRDGSGDLPHWPAYEVNQRAVLRLDEESCVLDDPYGARSAVWLPLLEAELQKGS